MYVVKGRATGVAGDIFYVERYHGKSLVMAVYTLLTTYKHGYNLAIMEYK